MSSPNIIDWKGEDIVVFQEALLKEVKGQISSKWFYTHMKSTGNSLPRIDVLNMLSQFIGFNNWTHFLANQAPQKEAKNSKIFYILFPILLVVLIPLLNQNEEFYTISIIDFDTNRAPENPIEFEHLIEGETAKRIFTDSIGKLILPVSEKLNKLVIKSPYYKEDTLRRTIKNEGGEIFKIKTDDYSLMVHYFSKSKVKDWKRRRRMLAKIFHDEAEIIEVYKGAYGIEKYTKQEFINKITMPLTSLKTLEVIDTQRQNGKIIKMRVAQQ